MANIPLLDVVSATTDETGTATTMDGGRAVLHISATSYGTNGKVVVKASSDGVNFTTLADPATTSGLAEYSADIIFNLDKLAQGWSIRADLIISTGTATVVKVVMGTN